MYLCSISSKRNPTFAPEIRQKLPGSFLSWNNFSLDLPIKISTLAFLGDNLIVSIS